MKNSGYQYDAKTLRKIMQSDGIPGPVIAETIYECFSQGYDPKKVNDVLNRMVSEKSRFRLLNPEPFEPLPSYEIPWGGLYLGDLANGKKLMSGAYMPVIFIAGATGTGKTNYFHLLLRQYDENWFKLLITYKIQEIPKDFVVFRCDSSVDYPELPVYVSAPNVPPKGVDFASWVKDRSRCFGQLAEFHEAGEGYYRETRLRAAEAYPGRILTEATVLEWMKQNAPKSNTESFKKYERNRSWLEIMRLDDPESFFASRGHDWEDWANNLGKVAILVSPNPSIWQKIKVYELISRIVKTCEANYDEKR